MKLGRPFLRYEEDPNAVVGEPGTPGGGGSGDENLPPQTWKPPKPKPYPTEGSYTDAEGHVIGPWATRLFNEVDSTISPAQWQTWINEAGPGGFDTKTLKFKSQRTLPDGTFPEGADPWVDKPVDTPKGYAAWGSGNFMLPETDPRISGIPTAPAGPVPTVATTVAKPRTLQDLLLEALGQRNTRTGLPSLYATWASGRSPLAERYDIEGLPVPLPADDVYTKGLTGGGGAISARSEADLAELGADIPDKPFVPFVQPKPVVPPVPSFDNGSTSTDFSASSTRALRSNAPLPGYLPEPMDGDVVLSQEYLPDLTAQLTGQKKRPRVSRWW